MEKLIQIIFISAVLLTGTAFAVESAIKPTDRAIPDKETLVYSIMENGKKTGDFIIVNTRGEEPLTVRVFMSFRRTGTKSDPPSHYTNFESRMLTGNGSILNFVDDSAANAITDNRRGLVYGQLTTNRTNFTAVYRMKNWNGLQLSESVSRMKFQPDVPVWNWNEVMFLGINYLNLKEGGRIQFVVPMYVKGVFQGRFNSQKMETVVTPAGSFRTMRYGFSMGDMLLGMLMSVYTREYHFWVDEKTGILIKETGSGNSSAVLESIGIWKDDMKN